MRSTIFAKLVLVGAFFAAQSAWAKLPAPPALDDAAKAKAAEAAAKTAWNGKVDGYMLCKSMDKSVVNFQKTAASAGKAVKPATATPACADPGPFVYQPAGAPPAASAATPAAAPAAAAPAKKS